MNARCAPLTQVAMVLLLAAAAAGLRIPSLGRASLGSGEWTFVESAAPGRAPFEALSRRLADGRPHPSPAAAMLQNLAERIMPDHLTPPLRHRIPGVWWGALAVVLLHGLARAAGTGAGSAAALWLACSCVPILLARIAGGAGVALAASAAAGLLAFRTLDRPGAGRVELAGLLLALLVAGWAHTAGLAVSAGVLALATARLSRRRDGDAEAERIRGLRVAAAGGIGFLLALPLALTAPLQEAPVPSQGTGWLAFVGQACWGTSGWSALPGWLFVAGGVLGLWVFDSGRASRRSLALAYGATAAAAWGWAAVFDTTPWPGSLVLPLHGVWCVTGWAAVVRRIAGPGTVRSAALGVALLAALLVPPAWRHLPDLYRLPATGSNYGAALAALGSVLEPGTPVIVEDRDAQALVLHAMREDVLTPLAPVPVSDDDTRPWFQRVRELRALFPEAALLLPDGPAASTLVLGDAARDAYGNEPLSRLQAAGLWPIEAPPHLRLVASYTTSELHAERARAAGQPAYVRYEGWRVREIRAGIYARVQGEAWSGVEVANLADRSVRGRFRIDGAVVGLRSTYDVEVRWMGQFVGTLPQAAGLFWQVDTGEVVVPRRGGRLEWGVPKHEADDVSGLLLNRVTFIPSS